MERAHVEFLMRAGAPFCPPSRAPGGVLSCPMAWDACGAREHAFYLLLQSMMWWWWWWWVIGRAETSAHGH